MRLSYRTAGRIAWRETRSSMTKFLFVVLAVAAGVGALSGWSPGIQRKFPRHAARRIAHRDGGRSDRITPVHAGRRSAAEIAALDALAKRGVEHTLITETISMASSAQAAPNSDAATPVLVSIKAVDPSKYPYYGAASPWTRRFRLCTTRFNRICCRRGAGRTAALRLNAKVGDSLRIGTGTFRISAVVLNEPDRMSGSLNVGLRMEMRTAALPRAQRPSNT